MRISKVSIRNYRNVRCVDIDINETNNGTTTFIGENNSGKSNILRAISLPLVSEDNSISKNLCLEDINYQAKADYYNFLEEHRGEIVNGTVSLDDFIAILPVVTVELQLLPKDTERYYVKDIAYKIDNGDFLYGLMYQYTISRPEELLRHLADALKNETVTIETIKCNLLPIQLYSHSITVPYRNDKVSYDVLKQFRYTSLPTERDGFSYDNNRIGSRSLVKLLENRFSNEQLIQVEQSYGQFFETLKSLGGIEEIINWSGSENIPNASEFIKDIDILPNMPSMSSIINGVRLGYAGENLSAQGLGHRNLILLLVLLNAMKKTSVDVALNVIIAEEPEAHLSINNVRLMCSFISALTKDNPRVQLMFSTHSSEMLNKHNLKNVVVLDEGNSYTLGTELTDEECAYLSKNPNTDLFKLFFSHRCILVEGISEELLIKGYISSKSELSDIDVISFHKGFKKIITIWVKTNTKLNKRLGIIRDYDDQPNAKEEHERLNGNGVCIKTTKEYTLEPELVKAGNNYTLLQNKYGKDFDWAGLSQDDMSTKWRGQKADIMYIISNDLSMGELDGFVLPPHIQAVMDFLTEKKDAN